MQNAMPKSIGIACFSPTGTTRTICNAVALGMGSEEPIVLDMTLPNTRAGIIANPSTAMNGLDHLIVGAPVYIGKIPLQAVECLKVLPGKGKECTAIVVYGNRDYGVALYRMVEILSNNGFTVVAAGTFIGQHSYSDIIPVAMGRPDKSDIEKARQFGAKVLSASKHLSTTDVPVMIDKASQSNKYSILKPTYYEDRCVPCGKCAQGCPLGLLSSDGGRYLSQTAKKQCIGCMACVRNCAQKARIAKPNLILKLILKKVLKQASIERKEPFIIV